MRLYASRPCMRGRSARHSQACSAGELWVWSAQVYKSHLVEGRQPAGPAVDSARQNLAATFVNAFVNAGFGQDKLVTGEVCRHREAVLEVFASVPKRSALQWWLLHVCVEHEES